MNIIESIRVALNGLIGNKMRSFLTMLGVIIGVAAVIIVVAIGQGLKQDTLQRIERLGTNLLMIRPGPGRRGGVATDMTVVNLQPEDAARIQRQVKSVRAVAPQIDGRVQAQYRNNNVRVELVGTTSVIPTVRNWRIGAGRFFNQADLRGEKRVCVLGVEVVEDLFDTRNPLGQFVRIKGLPFEVVGAIDPVGGGWGSPDDQIIAPITTVQHRIFGQDHLDMITVSAVSAEAVNQVETGIERLLRRQHKLRTGEPNDFRILKQSMFMESMAEAGETMTRLLGAIALVSLLVGGVGIMNIMLVSVTERTREIGIRKAVGATKLDILRQFLIESVVLSIIGGGLGILVGIGVSEILSSRSGWPAIVSPSSILYAFAFAAAVGIFFGLWPAKKAADMDPIVALRYE